MIPEDPRVPYTLRQVLDGLSDAAVVLSSERRILYYNVPYQMYSGKRNRAMAQDIQSGCRCCDFFTLEICKENCVLQEVRRTGRPIRMDEITAQRADGEKLKLIVTCTEIAPEVYVEIYRDVTADARVQAKYRVLLDKERRAKADLEKIVNERTAELSRANKELKQAQAILVHQEKMMSLGRLVAGIAHELNNPINFVYGNIDFLEEYYGDLLKLVDLYDKLLPQDPELRKRISGFKDEIEFDYLKRDIGKLLKSIRHGTERTSEIVRDLKTFSRPGARKMKKADLLEGLESTLNLLRPKMKNRIEVVREYETIPRIVCDIGHINQVFMNILTNAVEAIEGEGTIYIRARTTKSGVRLIIKDDGPGIETEAVPKLFEPFFTTKDTGKGTGLGLAICEGIVRHHGGRLGVESAPGKGAVFVIDLPFEPPSENRRRGSDEIGVW